MTEEQNHGRSLCVLHLVDSLRIGGKERQVVELLKGLRRTKLVETMVVTMGSEQFYVPDVEALEIPLVYLLRKVRWDPLIFPRLYGILRRFRPNIIHTNSDMAMFYAWPVARMMGIKLINGTIRNAFNGSGLRWQWHKLLLRLADVRVANSKAGFSSRGLLPDAPGNYVIYNGFDLPRIDNAATATDEVLGFEAGRNKIVGMVAEFSEYKDFSTFINAAQKILTRRLNVTFVMVGDGKTLASCKEMVLPGNADKIRFLGRRKDVESLVRRIDIGVLCTFTEGISNAVMEFMAASKPVVVTEGGGSAELIIEGEHGFRVPSHNADAVAEKIEVLLDDPALACRMGAAARLRVKNIFSLEQLVETSVAIYRTLARPND